MGAKDKLSTMKQQRDMLATAITSYEKNARCNKEYRTRAEQSLKSVVREANLMVKNAKGLIRKYEKERAAYKRMALKAKDQLEKVERKIKAHPLAVRAWSKAHPLKIFDEE